MLTELKLANFRVFDDEVTVRFRPITVFIGRNSSGKSSIIKFLLMLRQSIGYRSYDFLSPDGRWVNLGSFAELKNSLTRKNSLTFNLSAKYPIVMPTPEILESMPSLRDVPSSALLYKTGVTVPYGKCESVGNIYYSLVNEVSSQTVIKRDFATLSQSAFLRLPTDPNLKSIVQRNVAVLSDLEQIDELPPEPPDELKRPPEEIWNYISRIVQTVAEQELLRTLRNQIDSMYYLSSVRYELDRVIQASSPPKNYVDKDGQYALHHLQRIVDKDEALYAFLLSHIRKVAGIDDIEFRTPAGYVTQVYARNSVTGANALIADYGFGVGQCLPVLVQGAIMPQYSTLMVEQPEAQLHPTAQLELGSFFADLWKQRQVASIVETHSDNILLRLRRLIARGDLPHEDVSVAYFTFDEDNGNMPIVKNLDINEDGSMQPGLPMEFFGADIAEGLKLGVRK